MLHGVTRFGVYGFEFSGFRSETGRGRATHSLASGCWIWLPKFASMPKIAHGGGDWDPGRSNGAYYIVLVLVLLLVVLSISLLLIEMILLVVLLLLCRVLGGRPDCTVYPGAVTSISNK